MLVLVFVLVIERPIKSTRTILATDYEHENEHDNEWLAGVAQIGSAAVL